MASEWKTVAAKPHKRHHYSGAEARDLQRAHNVDNLADALRSPEAEDLFASGWTFDCVVKLSEPDPWSSSEREYREVAVKSRWGDLMRFYRTILLSAGDPLEEPPKAPSRPLASGP